MSKPRYPFRGASHQRRRQQVGRSGRINWPLVLTRTEVAAMCRISVWTFDNWVEKKILPKPILGTRRWSRIAIERALADQVVPSTAEMLPSPFEEWKHRNAH
jgi:predicted DNA-binding transcriptional regulator AlpA